MGHFEEAVYSEEIYESQGWKKYKKKTKTVVFYAWSDLQWQHHLKPATFVFFSDPFPELCCSDSLPEVEITSLIPRYQLRADSSIAFTGKPPTPRSFDFRRSIECQFSFAAFSALSRNSFFFFNLIFFFKVKVKHSIQSTSTVNALKLCSPTESIRLGETNFANNVASVVKLMAISTVLMTCFVRFPQQQKNRVTHNCNLPIDCCVNAESIHTKKYINCYLADRRII